MSRRKDQDSKKQYSFRKKDRGDVEGPHDDVIVLSLKINTHRVKRVLVDTGSSADILYLDAFKK
jgi:hypothetical protein